MTIGSTIFFPATFEAQSRMVGTYTRWPRRPGMLRRSSRSFDWGPGHIPEYSRCTLLNPAGTALGLRRRPSVPLLFTKTSLYEVPLVEQVGSWPSNPRTWCHILGLDSYKPDSTMTEITLVTSAPGKANFLPETHTLRDHIVGGVGRLRAVDAGTVGGVRWVENVTNGIGTNSGTEI
ncbi:hypothetical protein DFH07DRAFT_784078 [Mycena maculata]|uniref:Uncharacterized protein n=1 Tax=Mycena maculata TaxID=230809 RepID=A0AAD7HK61_9AGAR|nr:hypothetical protein DFH07DRAFT_784078 [Mycena maculata]